MYFSPFLGLLEIEQNPLLEKGGFYNYNFIHISSRTASIFLSTSLSENLITVTPPLQGGVGGGNG